MASSSSSSSSVTTRSRTLLFISYRDSRAGSSRFRRRSRLFQTYDDSNALEGDEQDRLIDSEAGHVSIDAELPPKWVDIAEQVEEILADTQAKIAALDKLHARHVLPGFTDRSAEEREIEAATSEITKDFRRCHSLIQRIAATAEHAFPPSNASRNEALAAKNVQRGLAAKIQELSATFRKKQRVYMEKLQGHAIKNQDMLVASGKMSLKGSEGWSAVDEDMEAAHASRSQAMAQDLLLPDQDLRARDRELTEIAKSIGTLAELFKELSTLVIDQGTLLDSVEYNIEQTAVQMEDAVKELNIATRYQKNTGRRQCIFLLLLIIFGLILVLIFKPRRHNASSAPEPHDPVQTTSALLSSIPTSSTGTAGTVRRILQRRPSG
ncbi:t-SNARE [Panus rudis PR-1116 ss-1]|nr:t-SNARE [Panus rudis PR-1116 ss-1]